MCDVVARRERLQDTDDVNAPVTNAPAPLDELPVTQWPFSRNRQTCRVGVEKKTRQHTRCYRTINIRWALSWFDKSSCMLIEYEMGRNRMWRM